MKLTFEPIIIKNSHVTFCGHFGSHVENMKMPVNEYFMQKN